MSVLVIGQHYWGHGKDVAEAKKIFKQQGGVLSNGYAIVDFGDDLEFEGVNPIGYVLWKGEGDPKVTQIPPKGKNAVWATRAGQAEDY